MSGDWGSAESRRSFDQQFGVAGAGLDIDYTAVVASLDHDFRAPDRSALSVRGLRIAPRLTAVLGAMGGLGLLAPQMAAIMVMWLVFLCFSILVAWRIWLLLVATTPGFERPSHAIASEVDLPTYSVLIALYREGQTIAGLADALGNLSWPEDRKEVILLTEAGDRMTQAAIAQANWPGQVRVITLPPGAPRTKPRALNYGLANARGDYVCVFDAEDRPHPAQLQAAHAAFRQGGKSLACVQAPLAGDNHRESWVALQWSLEYAVQFGLLLPALSRLNLPLLLGGTSNHFRRSALQTAGGWDAWNVTEDADLGARLSAKGYRTATIAPPTFEEAPEVLSIWAGQRSRWLKGFLQTWVVMMRRPIRAVRELGLLGFISLQLGLIGTCIAALAHAPLMITTVALMLAGAPLPDAAMLLMLLGYSVNAVAVLIAPGPKGMRRWFGALTLPLYWPLQSLAAARALYGYIKSPHFWAKTPHGMTAARR